MKFLFLLIIVITLAHAKDCCVSEDSQKIACTADFVTVVRCIGKLEARLASILFDKKLVEPKEKDSIVHQLQVQQIFKNPVKSPGLLKVDSIVNITTLAGDPCAPKLTQGQIYLMTGDLWAGELEVTKCDLRPWGENDQSQEEKQGFSNDYYKNC